MKNQGKGGWGLGQKTQQTNFNSQWEGNKKKQEKKWQVNKAGEDPISSGGGMWRVTHKARQNRLRKSVPCKPQKKNAGTPEKAAI